MFRFSRKNSIYFRIVASLLVAVLLCMTMIWVIVCPRLERSLQHRNEERCLRSMEQTVNALNNIFSRIDAAVIAIEDESKMRAFNLQTGGPEALMDACNIIHLLTVSRSDILHGIYYHVISNNTVIGSHGTYSMDMIGKNTLVFDGLDAETVKGVLEEPSTHNRKLLPSTYVKADVHSSLQVAVLPYFRSVSGNGKAYASVMFLFSTEALRKELLRSWNDDTLFITDGNRILFSTNTQVTDALGDRYAFSPQEERHTDQGTLYVSSTILKDLYIGAVVDGTQLAQELRILRITNLNGILLALFASCIVVFVLTKWNYQPFANFLKEIGVENIDWKNDSQIARERFSHLLTSNQRLSEDLSRSRYQLKHAVLEMLITSAGNEKSQLLEKAYAQGVLQGKCRCYLLLCANEGEIPKINDRNMEHVFSVGSYRLCLMELEADCVLDLNVQFPGKWCVSEEFCCWDDMPERASSLLMRAETLAKMDDGLYHVDDPVFNKIEEKHFDSQSLMENLFSAFRKKETEQIRFLRSRMASWILDEEVLITQKRECLFEVLEETCKYLRDEEKLDESILQAINPFSKTGFTDMDNMVSVLSTATEAVIATFPKEVGGELSYDVLLYIQNHLLDPNFSIYTVSEEFKMTESAFSHLFKRTYGKNFSTYVNQQKLILAFELLKDQTLTLDDIAIRLGYSRASNFGRMFKSEVGITPGQYRGTKSKDE